MDGWLINTNHIRQFVPTFQDNKYEIKACYDCAESSIVIFSYDTREERDKRMEMIYEKLRS